MPRRVLSDRGAATVFVVIALAVIMFATMAVAAIGGLVAAHRRAQSAADLAALAGAVAVGTAADPCAAARAVAEANVASIESCQVAAAAVTVIVSVQGPELMGSVVRLRGVARAGR